MDNLITAFYLTDEQQLFISKALEGHNILVDACIGSGKTTAIQQLCCEYPEDKKILYLTYNKLLKLDAKSKIKNKNVTVTNYHGFAASVLYKAGIHVGISDMIQTFNSKKPEIEKYDVLVLDEYQDIELELAQMLEYIKSINPQVQIVAVGDMQQKIYDKTTLDVLEFIEGFLGNYIKLEFTKCFRLSAPLAARLGRIWKKRIVGVNENCLVEEMNVSQVVDFLAQQEPKDILCLGARRGKMSDVLNALELNHSEKFNKKTVYASISDRDSTGATEPKKTSAIFTTYDSSKGLERKICVIFNYTESFWHYRINRPQQSYEILRNIFCVAASRGKDRIIFVNHDEEMLSEETLSKEVVKKTEFENVNISEMFEFKYKENVEECFSLLNIKRVEKNDNVSEIHIKNKDELIDLSPCVGIYQEAVFFGDYDIDKSIDFIMEFEKIKGRSIDTDIKKSSLDNKILFLTSLETNQNRYRTQVETPYVMEGERELLIKRLSTEFSRNETVQVECSIDFSDEEDGQKLFSARGMVDVLKNDIVYELKFVSELTHEHFLQCASYVVALGLEKGILWNTRKNEQYEITISNRELFLDAVTKTVTKTQITKYFKPRKEHIAVIDTETTWSNRVMSIGVVIADVETFEKVDAQYYVLIPENSEGGMYSASLEAGEEYPAVFCDRGQAVLKIKEFLQTYNAKSIFAYNASFDLNHFPELTDGFMWYDIMRLAAYRQFNSKIPQDAECYSTGRLKSNYGVEAILRMLTQDNSYYETHNALLDALDELKIMSLLGQKLEVYNKNAWCEKRRTHIPATTRINQERPAVCSSALDMSAFRTEIERIKRENQQQRELQYQSKSQQQSQPQKENVKKQIIEQEEKISGYTAKQISCMLGKSQHYVYRLIHRGVLPAKKIKNCYYVERNDLDNYFKQLERANNFALITALITIAVAVLGIIIIFH